MRTGGWLLEDPSLLNAMEQMTVAAKGRVSGTMQGKRRSRLLGSSQEFADFRPYVPGDDIRRLDWNVYGRTGKAFVRQYWDEQEMDVRLYIDVSPSMGFGLAPDGIGSGNIPPDNKLAFALRLAACVGYAALSGEDRVTVCTFADRIVARLPTVRGRGAAVRLFDFLAQQLGLPDGSGTEDLYSAFAEPGAYPRLPGQSWLFTDGLYETGIAQTLDGFAAARQHLVFVHVLGPAELYPDLSGELRLIDAESGQAKEVAFGQSVHRAYKMALEAHCESIRKRCAERGFDYLLVDASASIFDTAVHGLLAAGLLKR
jgi:uncharacterized protein (DUF58 family)